MRHCLLVLAAAFGMLGLVAPGSSQAAGPQVPGLLVAQYNPYHQQQQQQGLLLTQLGVLLAMAGAIGGAIFAARARKQKQEREEAEQRQRDAQRRRAEEGERRGNS